MHVFIILSVFNISSDIYVLSFFFRELTNSKEEIAYLKRALKEQVIMHDILINLHTALLEKLNYTFFLNKYVRHLVIHMI